MMRVITRFADPRLSPQGIRGKYRTWQTARRSPKLKVAVSAARISDGNRLAHYRLQGLNQKYKMSL